MDALERLTAYLCNQVGSRSLDSYHEGYAKRILDQHAHELAEKIRAMNEGCGRTECVSCAHRSNAADLIDPEVTE